MINIPALQLILRERRIGSEHSKLAKLTTSSYKGPLLSSQEPREGDYLSLLSPWD
jgi:hypothetical protein